MTALSLQPGCTGNKFCLTPNPSAEMPSYLCLSHALTAVFRERPFRRRWSPGNSDYTVQPPSSLHKRCVDFLWGHHGGLGWCCTEETNGKVCHFGCLGVEETLVSCQYTFPQTPGKLRLHSSVHHTHVSGERVLLFLRAFGTPFFSHVYSLVMR